MYKIKQIPEDFIVEEIYEPELSKGPYTYFKLKKRLLNTEDAINIISKKFKIPRKLFSYSGTKDRNAITTQIVSVKGNIKDFSTKDLEIKKVGKGNKPVSLGFLIANKFNITVRNIEKVPNKISFIPNYFDDQRFGSNNLEIGLSLLKKDFEKAAQLIDDKNSIEFLKNNPTNYIGAIRCVPFNILKMYINSVQSYIFNEVLSNLIRNESSSKCKYKHGTFHFPKSKIVTKNLPLISFDSEFDDKKIKEEYEKLLNVHKITQRDFIIRSIPGITPHGGIREAFVDVSNLSFGQFVNDEMNKGKQKIRISFDLPKGSYATIVIKSMFSNF